MRPLRDHLARLLIGEITGRSSSSDGPSLVEPLLRDAAREGASDIHVEPHGDGWRVRLRIDGVALDAAMLSADQGAYLINQFKVLAGLDPIATVEPQEGRRTFALDERELDLRITSATCINGDRLAVRILDPSRVEQRIGELGLNASMMDQVERWLGNVEGMFLVTGPTGSGKTTTLYALLHELRMFERTIVTIEDPVEYEIEGISQMQVNASHGLSFAKGLKGMLRLDPDYLLVGEIRDSESARAAVDAAASGRVLLSTLHSRDAVGAVTSLRNWGMADHEICATLSVVVAQRLVRTLCSHCRVQQTPNDREGRWLKAMGLHVPDEVWHGRGCDECSNLGYRGRTGLFEVWPVDEEDYELILAHADERSIRQRLAAKGHAFLFADAIAKARSGVTSYDELRTVGGLGVASPGLMAATELDTGGEAERDVAVAYAESRLS